MLTFAADPRDGSMSSDACTTCCCLAAQVRPGETNKWLINYANWVNPIGGRGLVGLPVFDIKNITPSPSLAPTNGPPTNADYAFTATFETAFTGTVATSASDPNSDSLTYALVPIYGPRNGTVTIAPNGAFTYTPRSGFSGYDTFFYTTSDQINRPVMNQVTMKVNPASPAVALPAPAAPQLLAVPPALIMIKNPVLQFPVVASPALRVGDIWRMTVRQAAMDCDGAEYFHTMCFDTIVGAC